MDSVRIAISQPDGSVAIMEFLTLVRRFENDPGYEREASPENIEAELAKSGFGGRPWRIIELAEIPQDRTFRNAWCDTGSAIEHDMEKARAIHMGRIRAARNAKLADSDKLVAALDGDPVPSELKAMRQKLRDIPQTIDLKSAADVEQLKAIWPKELSR